MLKLKLKVHNIFITRVAHNLRTNWIPNVTARMPTASLALIDSWNAHPSQRTKPLPSASKRLSALTPSLETMKLSLISVPRKQSLHLRNKLLLIVNNFFRYKFYVNNFPYLRKKLEASSLVYLIPDLLSVGTFLLIYDSYRQSRDHQSWCIYVTDETVTWGISKKHVSVW